MTIVGTRQYFHDGRGGFTKTARPAVHGQLLRQRWLFMLYLGTLSRFLSIR